jgi:hypothetical protein
MDLPRKVMNDIYMTSLFSKRSFVCARTGSGFGQDMDPSADGLKVGDFDRSPGKRTGIVMANELSLSKLNQALDWAYEKAMDGIPGAETAREFAEEYRKNNDSALDAANSLIRWQNTKAATSGFLTGLGGVITLPVTIPANVASVMYVQLRMITAMAYLGGHDPRDDRVKTLVYTCLAGNAAKDILKDVGIVVASKVAMSSINNISRATITKINQAVGFRLLTKFGSTGAINLGKAVPLLGGLVGAAFDSVTTNTVGNVARDIFVLNPAPITTTEARSVESGEVV